MIHSENSKKRYRKYIRNITRKILNYEEELDNNSKNSYIVSLKLGKCYYERGYLKYLYKEKTKSLYVKDITKLKKEILKDLKKAMKFNPKYTQNQCKKRKLFIIEYYIYKNSYKYHRVLYSIIDWYAYKHFYTNHVSFISYLPEDCYNFFCDLKKLTKIPDNLITLHVTNMKRMFADCENFNQNISNWDISNVINTKDMFINCKIDSKNKPRKKSITAYNLPNSSVLKSVHNSS